MTIALLGYCFFIQAQHTLPEQLIITPEKSDFIKTSSYAEVRQFIDAMQKMNSNMHTVSMGRSLEGKDIPVVILSNPLVKTPEEAAASGKPVIYIQGNIHAGEVEGKEAIMMLMRDILLGNKTHLLNNQIILLAPIYNTDSNDKMEKGRRPSQEDSPLETGLRENSQGLDLNRDGVKMEAPETQGLFTNIISKWDPQLFVDLHTTNGTWHAYSLTYAPSYHYAGEVGTYDYTLNNIIKSVVTKAKFNYDLNIGPYGDYEVEEGWPPRNFYTYNHHPRYLVNQFSLRNRMAILSEAFSHERFYQRIHSTYSFIAEILEYTNAHTKEIEAVNAKAEQRTIQNVIDNAGKVKKGVRFKMVPLQKLDSFPTYEYVSYLKPDGTKVHVRSGKIVRYNDITYHAKFEAERESTLPRGYIIPAAFSKVVENLRSHGVQVSALTKSRSLTGEVFVVDKIENAANKFEGHFMMRIFGNFMPAKRTFKKGDYLVDLAQPLGNLAFYLLEPESDDGLVTWNFFDSYFDSKKAEQQSVEYPIFKFYK